MAPPAISFLTHHYYLDHLPPYISAHCYDTSLDSVHIDESELQSPYTIKTSTARRPDIKSENNANQTEYSLD